MRPKQGLSRDISGLFTTFYLLLGLRFFMNKIYFYPFPGGLTPARLFYTFIKTYHVDQIITIFIDHIFNNHVICKKQ